MARCEGTTRSGARCRLDARPGSRFCHLHEAQEEDRVQTENEEEGGDVLEMEDLLPLLLAGILAAGTLLLLRTLGKWLPRL